MNVMDDLRMPDIENLVDDELRLDLRESVPIAIVIMAGVLMIKLRRIGSFVRRAQGFLVPVVDDVDAIGVRRRHQENDCIPQDLFNFRLIRRREPVCDQHAG